MSQTASSLQAGTSAPATYAAMSQCCIEVLVCKPGTHWTLAERRSDTAAEALSAEHSPFPCKRVFWLVSDHAGPLNLIQRVTESVEGVKQAAVRATPAARDPSGLSHTWQRLLRSSGSSGLQVSHTCHSAQGLSGSQQSPRAYPRSRARRRPAGASLFLRLHQIGKGCVQPVGKIGGHLL